MTLIPCGNCFQGHMLLPHILPLARPDIKIIGLELIFRPVVRDILNRSGDLGRIINVLTFADDDTRSGSLEKLMDHATNVETITGSCLDWESAAMAFQEAFQSELKLDLLSGELTSKEKEKISELIRTKYSNPEWTERT